MTTDTMYDIVADKKDVLKRCEEIGITPLIIGKDVELVNEITKTSKALLTIATSSKREVIESNIDAITDIESSKKEDFMHHRNSGLDQVKTHIMRQRVNPYILNLNAFLHAKKQDIVLGRMQQNARICKKLQTPILFASFAQTPEDLPTPHDHAAFWRAMGIDPKTVADNQHAFLQLVERSKRRADAGYVAEGVQKTSE